MLYLIGIGVAGGGIGLIRTRKIGYVIAGGLFVLVGLLAVLTAILVQAEGIST